MFLFLQPRASCSQGADGRHGLHPGAAQLRDLQLADLRRMDRMDRMATETEGAPLERLPNGANAPKI